MHAYVFVYVWACMSLYTLKSKVCIVYFIENLGNNTRLLDDIVSRKGIEWHTHTWHYSPSIQASKELPRSRKTILDKDFLKSPMHNFI